MFYLPAKEIHSEGRKERERRVSERFLIKNSLLSFWPKLVLHLAIAVVLAAACNKLQLNIIRA